GPDAKPCPLARGHCRLEARSTSGRFPGFRTRYTSFHELSPSVNSTVLLTGSPSNRCRNPLGQRISTASTLTISARPKCCSKGRQPKLVPPETSRNCLRPPASIETRAPIADRLLFTPANRTLR